MSQNVTEKYLKKYNELQKKREVLANRYAELEKLENELISNTKISDETRLANLNKLAQEYEKVANLMKGVVEELEKLNTEIDKVLNEVDE